MIPTRHSTRLLSLSNIQRVSMSSSLPPLSFKASTPSSVRAEAQAIIEKFKASINDIKDGKCGDPFATLSLALGDASAESARVTLPSMVHEDAEVRAESNRMKDALANMFSAAFTDSGLLRALSDKKQYTSKQISEEDEKFRRDVTFLLEARNGGNAPQDIRHELQNTRQQIEALCTAFCSCINENEDHLLFSDDELRGVGDIDRFPLDYYTKKRKVSLKAPSTLPVLKFARNAETRRTVLEALSKKCQEENTPRFEQVLKLRHEAANILATYPHHAAYQLAPKMASDVKCATEFLNECVSLYKPKLEREMKLLTDLKKELHPEEGGLQAWDMEYYIREFKARCAGVDEASLRQYFPLEHVKGSILSIYEELLELKFVREIDADIWHSDVECYSVSDASTGERHGYFYLDLFPRDGKYSHQCVYPLRPSYVKDDGTRVPPACVNLCNLTPPREGSPSLLLFREVETFFHEFGHVMHCVLTKSKHTLHSWAWSAVPWPGGVEQDFLEVPSMMLENFVWQPEILQRLSSHIDDGSSLPDQTIRALNNSRMLMTGFTKMKYLAMALYDLRVHTSAGPDATSDKQNPYVVDEVSHNASSLFNAMMKKYTGMEQVKGSFAGASWLHLMQGYDAGYYGYIYSECYAADLFSEFEALARDNKPIIDSELGRKYRQTILERGATKCGVEMLIDFLGREPSNEAFSYRVKTS
eukprot:CCRYP_019218-RA/>CCRYP_019218-RA protein AED:0.24 eAED:0.24 QI:77/1/1/1/0.33/0.25/4/1423/702